MAKEGYSSDMSEFSAEEISVKRRRMMRCLQEIQTLVGTEMNGDKETVLSQLQSVVDHIKKMQSDDKDEADTKAVVPCDATTLPESAYNPVETMEVDTGFCEESYAIDPILQKRGDYRMAVSCATRKIKEVSPDMRDFLGFSEEDLINEPFNKLIHEKDILTFGSSVSALNLGRTAEGRISERAVSFFMRLWHNRAKSWYSNSHGARYSIMYSGVHVHELVEERAVSREPSLESSRILEQELSDSVHSALQSSTYTSCGSAYEGKMWYMINCSPIQSAYKVRDQLPKRQCFSFKHSPSCVFTYIDPSAIPLIGYLPQDIVGSSLFQYYHPDDLTILYSAYRSLTTRCTKTACSQPVRFKVRNGEFIIVETELSCFINPWSHRLDFVIGKHSVVRGPKNMDVFAEFGSSKMLNEWFPEFQQEHKDVQNNIILLLAKPIKGRGSKDGKSGKTELSKSEDSASGSVPNEETQNSPKTDSSQNNKGSKNTDESHEGDSSNPYGSQISSDLSQWDQQEINKVYNSLAYLQGIQRLLVSQYGPEEGGVRIQIPATHTLHCTLENDLNWMSNSASVETGSEEDDASFPHPPSQPASSTKAMLLEDLDQQILSPREADAAAQSDDNLAGLPELDQVEEPHIHKLTFENLQLHEQYQRNCYLESLLKDSEMKLFYETVSVPKLMRNLRNKMRKRRTKDDSPNSDANENKILKKKKKESAEAVPINPNFAITCIEDSKPCGYPVHAQQSARPQPEVGASLLHAHHPLYMANFSIVPVLSAAPLYTYSDSQFRYSLGKSQHSTPILPYLVQTKQFQDDEIEKPSHNASPNWFCLRGNGSGSGQQQPAQQVPLSLQIPADNTNTIGEQVIEKRSSQAEQATEFDEEASTSSACIFDSSCTDNSTEAVQFSKNDEKMSRRPFWLEDLHPSFCHEQMLNYEVDVSHQDELEAFRARFSSNSQARELYQQVLEFELGKLDLDPDEDSDTSSLFLPFTASEMAQQLSDVESLPIKMVQDPYTDTDSGDFLNNITLQKKRKSRTRAKLPAPVTERRRAEESRKSSQNSIKEVEECGEKGESEGDSVASIDTKSNVGSDKSASKSHHSDSSKENSLKNGSTASSVGYQGSAEMSSSGDVYSIDDCSDYKGSNREFCKVYDKEKLMEYCVDLENSEDPVSSIQSSLCQVEQPTFLVDQLNELVHEFTRGVSETSAEEEVDEQVSRDTEPKQAITADKNSSTMEVLHGEQASRPGRACLKSSSASQGDSGFLSTSTLSFDERLYERQNNGGMKDFSTGTSSVMSSVEGSVGKSSGASQQCSNDSASANNGSSNGSSNGGNSSGGSDGGMETGSSKGHSSG